MFWVRGTCNIVISEMKCEPSLSRIKQNIHVLFVNNNFRLCIHLFASLYQRSTD